MPDAREVPMTEPEPGDPPGTHLSPADFEGLALNSDPATTSPQDESTQDATDATWSFTPDSHPADMTRRHLLDITTALQTASQSIDHGSLIKDDYFDLMEAVGALEMLDPKMDSGFIEADDESCSEPNYEVPWKLSIPQVIWVMDELLCYEMAWHQGNPLNQTLFTCLYIERILEREPKTIEDATFHRPAEPPSRGFYVEEVLRAYSLGVIKSTEGVIQTVHHHLYFEEEDICTRTFNREFPRRIESSQVDKLIQGIVARPPLQAATQSADAASDEPSDGDDVQVSDNEKNAILSRLRFRQALVRATAKGSIQDFLRSMIIMERELRTIQDTHDLSVAIPEVFDEKVQRRLASTVPPRPVVKLSFEAAHDQMKQLISDNLKAMEIGKTFSSVKELRNFVEEFSARDPMPLPWSRGVIQSFLVQQDFLEARRIIVEDWKATMLCGHPSLNPRNWTIDRPYSGIQPAAPGAVWASVIDEYSARILQVYQDVLANFCQNRTRLRRLSCKAILDLHELETYAEEIDQDHLHATGDLSPLLHWTRFEKLRLMELIVQLGFEQEVYLPDELYGMYWYLEYLMDTRSAEFRKMHAFMQRTSESKSHDPAALPRSQKHLQYFDAIGILLPLQRFFSQSLNGIYMILLGLGKVKIPDRAYNNPILRHELRMKPFLRVDYPPVPNWQHVLDSLPQKDLHRPLSPEHLEEARDRFDNLQSFVTDYAARQVDDLRKIEPVILGRRFSLGGWNQELAKYENLIEKLAEWVEFLRPYFASGFKEPLEDFSIEVPSAKERLHPFFLVPILKRSSAGEGSS